MIYLNFYIIEHGKNLIYWGSNLFNTGNNKCILYDVLDFYVLFKFILWTLFVLAPSAIFYNIIDLLW